MPQRLASTRSPRTAGDQTHARTHRPGSSAIRRRFTDSEELLRARAYRPEDRRMSAVLVSGVAACMAGLLSYLAIWAC